MLVTGGGGLLGRALARRATAHERRPEQAGRSIELVALGRAALDITDDGAIMRAIDTHAPEVVVNAAAYTAVDRAEIERGSAFAVNMTGAWLVARACAARGIALLHVSTDYVFDGTATRPYREDDAVAPLSAYGASKAAGEAVVRAAGGTVVRTSWLFGEGAPGFTLMAERVRAGDPMRVVADQHGCPTWVDDLADALLALATIRDRPDVLHYCGEGPTTWHGLAVAMAETIGADPSRITAITTADWNALAPRPAYAVLDTERMRSLGIAPRPWRRGLLTTLPREPGSTNNV